VGSNLRYSLITISLLREPSKNMSEIPCLFFGMSLCDILPMGANQLLQNGRTSQKLEDHEIKRSSSLIIKVSGKSLIVMIRFSVFPNIVQGSNIKIINFMDDFLGEVLHISSKPDVDPLIEHDKMS
jgi:hypothetical protein